MLVLFKTGKQSVVLSCATAVATIYYTTDNTTPTTNSTQYTSPFTLAATTTVKAITVKEGMPNNPVLTVTLTKYGSAGGSGGAVVPPAQTPDPELTTEPTINKFTDINENDWFYNAVKFAVDT